MIEVVCSVTAVGAIGASSLPIPPAALAPPGLTVSAPGLRSDYPLLELPISYVLSGGEWDQLNRLGDVNLFPIEGLGPVELRTGPQPVDEPTALTLLLSALICLIIKRLALERA